MNYNGLVDRLMSCDILNITKTNIHDFYHKFTEKLKVGINNLNRIRQEYPIGSVGGTLTTALLEFSYAFEFAKNYNTPTDFALMSAFMIPLFVGFYLDEIITKKKKQINNFL